MAATFRQRMADFLFFSECQTSSFRNIQEGRERWEYVEKEAVVLMNVVETCLYYIYFMRWTTDVSIITPIINATFDTSYTKTEIDGFLVPVRALYLMQLLVEEEIVIGIERLKREKREPFDVRHVHHW
jgi:hypothetical protein